MVVDISQFEAQNSDTKLQALKKELDFKTKV